VNTTTSRKLPSRDTSERRKEDTVAPMGNWLSCWVTPFSCIQVMAAWATSESTSACSIRDW